MKRLLVILACGTLASTPAEAQQLTIGAGYSLADYREQAAFLHFRGSGPAATLVVQRGRMAVRVDVSHLSLSPSGESSSQLESFNVDQIGVRVGLKAVSLVGIEAGYTRRSTSPGRAAQSYDALIFGLRADYPLAPGAAVGLRTAYVAATGFTGGGSAPLGLELGLTAAYGPSSSRFRVTGDFEFQRIDRRTEQNGGRLNVPIQSSVARVGLAVTF